MVSRIFKPICSDAEAFGDYHGNPIKPENNEIIRKYKSQLVKVILHKATYDGSFNKLILRRLAKCL